MVKVAIYTRISAEKENREDRSLGTQQKRCKDWCQRQFESGFDHEVFSDVCSGTTRIENRESGKKLIISLKEFDYIVVNRLDRMFRNVADCSIKLSLFKRYNVKFVSLTDQVDTSTATGDLMVNMLSSIAQFEAKLDGERIRETNAATAASGKWTGGQYAAFGYNYNSKTKKLELNPDEAPIVKMIFAWYTKELLSGRAIADKLNAMKILTKAGKLWMSQRVISLLRNAIYNGKIIYGRRKPVMSGGKDNSDKRWWKKTEAKEWQVSQGLHQSIVTEEEFNQAQKMLGERKKTASFSRLKRHHLLTGRLRCGLCGYSLGVKTCKSTPKNPRKTSFSTYYCRGYVYGGKHYCKGVNANYKRLNTAVFQAVKENLEATSFVDGFNEHLKNGKSKEKFNVEPYLKRLNEKYNRQTEMYENGLITIEQLKEKKALLDKEVAELTQASQNEARQPLSVGQIKKFETIWKKMTAVKRKMFLREIIETIVVKKGEATIKFKPLRLQGWKTETKISGF